MQTPGGSPVKDLEGPALIGPDEVSFTFTYDMRNRRDFEITEGFAINRKSLKYRSTWFLTHKRNGTSSDVRLDAGICLIIKAPPRAGNKI